MLLQTRSDAASREDPDFMADDLPPDRLPRLKILFPEGSSTSARQALYALGADHQIDILDPSGLCQCRFSCYVNRWYRCPSFRDDPSAYLKFLLERLEAEHYDILLPTHEQIFLLSRVKGTLEQRVQTALPAFSVIDRMMSKANFARLLDEIGLPQPESRIASERSDLESIRDLPQFLKVDYSTAGQGVRLVRNSEDLAHAIDAFGRAGWLDGSREILIQKPAVGRKSSVKSVFCRGRLIASHCAEARALGVGGSSVAEIGVSHPIVVDHVARLGAHLKWHGGMALEYFYDAQRERPQYLECNPRLGETGGAWANGLNLPQHLIRVARDESAADLSARQGIQTHQAFLVLMAKAVDGCGRQELLREIRHILTRTRLYHQSQDVMTRPIDDIGSLIPALWVSMRLLIRPSASQQIVERTVNNYSLTPDAAERIRRMS